eukprot:TRINITY_DN66442_c0_g1_i1.p3 TRINITY_DN66442_c0_g1~~TRINITY_DN66442_c0_g1_i1.p3  ORF type:complete len:150 (-),score=31.62 TRINITY_DN66442_c0_g1_i1:116-565(-)
MAYEEGVNKANMWALTWASDMAQSLRNGTAKEPSPWIIGDFGRPVKLAPLRRGGGRPQSALEAESERSSRSRSSLGSLTGSDELGSEARRARTADQPRRGRGRVASVPTLPNRMATSHALTEHRLNFSTEFSVLSPKFTGAYKIPRRMK